MKTIFQMSNAAGMGDVGIEAEKVLENCKDLTADLDAKLRERKKVLSQRRREKAMMSMKKLSSPKDESGGAAKPAAAAAAVGAAAAAVAVATPKKSGPPKIETPAWMLAEMAGMDEEDDAVVCCVCGEGYTFQPNEVMGVYAFASRKSVQSLGTVEGNTLFPSLPQQIDATMLPDKDSKKQKLAVVDENSGLKVGSGRVEKLQNLLKRALKGCHMKPASSNSRSLSVYCTVSASNAIHSTCHQRAAQADKKHPKDPKGEWQGATMRNSRVKTNCLLPLKGYGMVNEVQYVESIEKFYSNVGTATGISPASSSSLSRTFLAIHDIKSLTELLVSGDSMSEGSEGGSITSNCLHLLRLFGFARGVASVAELNGEPEAHRAKATAAAFAIIGSLNRPNEQNLVNGAPFALVSALLFENKNFWADHAKVFCR
jgi:hypothetical protein